jgi:hypothetical protein
MRTKVARGETSGSRVISNWRGGTAPRAFAHLQRAIDLSTPVTRRFTSGYPLFTASRRKSRYLLSPLRGEHHASRSSSAVAGHPPITNEKFQMPNDKSGFY